MRFSESFTATVVNSLMRGPGWPDTLLIWLHDTWGGYYDHVPPPVAVPPDDIPDATQSGGTGSYDRLGFRVPAILVSPYARPDYVSSTVYDHTSVLKLIERKFNLPPLTRRDAVAADPLEMIDLDSPPVFLTPPQLAAPVSRRPGFRIDASPAFRIRSTRDLFSSFAAVAAAWGVGLLAFSGGSFWFQSIVLLVLTLLTIQGVRDSGFWRQWIFWRAPKIGGTVALYNAVFAFLTLSVFCALVSSEFYRYGLFHIAESHLGGNILWMYTATYFWNLVDAIPGLEITGTLHWDSPLQFSNTWGELFLILFRLLVLAPLLTVIAEFISDSGKKAKPTSGKPVRPASRRRRREVMRRLPPG